MVNKNLRLFVLRSLQKEALNNALVLLEKLGEQKWKEKDLIQLC